MSRIEVFLSTHKTEVLIHVMVVSFIKTFSGLVKISLSLLLTHEAAVKIVFCAHLKVLALCVHPYAPISLSHQT